MKLSNKTSAKFTCVWGWHHLSPLKKEIVLTKIANQGYLAELATRLIESDIDSPHAVEFLASQYVEAACDILEKYDDFCMKTESCEYAALSSESECIIGVAMTLAENIIGDSHKRLMLICRLIALTPC